MLLKTIKDFQDLEFGQRVYTFKDRSGFPEDHRYAGLSPVKDGEGKQNYIMLVSGNDVSKISTLHTSSLKRYANGYGWWTSFDECKLNMLKHMVRELQSVKDTWFDEWKEDDWRDFNLQVVLDDE